MQTGDKEYKLSWEGVFNEDPNGPLLYSVSIGSGEGQTDILRPMSTTGISVGLTLETDDATEFYVVIKAISVTGQHSIYRKIIPL